jgi:hypothetical protein
MGEVVAFRNKERQRAESAPREGAAQILFFLGVRYQRQEDHLNRLESLGCSASTDGPDAASGSRRSGGTRARRKKRA